jgi:hypothetical protein
MRWAGNDVTRLQAIAAARNYKPGWIYHVLKHQRDAADNSVLNAVWSE